MEFFSLRSASTLTPSLPSSSLLRRFGIEKSAYFSGQAVSFPRSSKSCLDSRNLRHGVIGSAQDTAGTVRKTIEVIKQEMSSKDVDLAFIAGATGRVGSRTVRELLKLGFHVRAGVRSAQRAETLVQSVRQMMLGNVIGSSGIQPIERLEIVECDLENQSGIRPAIGNASTVICCIGASEKEVFDVTGPYRIDYRATKNLIDAATFAKVDHFILLTSLGTNKIGFPAAILNLFWGVLIWKRKAEEALIASGLPYTIVRPGGMERPTDAYKETHNLVLANEDTLFGGQVSNLQVAELMACMAKNRRLSYCKVVEVIAETTAPLTPMEELLAKIPSQRELPTELDSEPVPPSIDSKSTMSVIEDKPIQKEEPQIRPLSPYTMYDDLKPPSSPSPTPSTTPSGTQQKQVDAVQAKPESEPTSTSPEEVTEKDPVRAQTAKPSPLSPYMAYEDLKPPATPCPTPKSASSGSKEKVSDATSPLESNRGNGAAGASTTLINEEENEQHLNQQKTQPLSPFTMYEDLKPPSSPVPSLPK